MQNNRNPVAALAVKVEKGDPAARLQLREQMESQMVFIVRRTLQAGKGVTSLDRRILAEARRLDAQGKEPIGRDPEHRVRAIANVLCAAVLSNLRPAPLDARHAHETVVEHSQAAY